MNPLGGDWVFWAQACLANLFRASWQGGMVIALVWLISRCDLLPPRLRSWLWRLACLKMLLLIAIPWTIELPWFPPSPPDLATSSVEYSQAAEPQRQRVVSGEAASAHPLDADLAQLAPHKAFSDRFNVLVAMMVTWLAGATLLTGVLIVRIRSARRWRQGCKLVKDATILSLCDDLMAELRIEQPPVLFVSDTCETPTVFGAVRTSVILPARLVQEHDLSRLRLVLRHEFAHVARNDVLWNWLATLAWLIFFFHPLVWLALRELRLTQELACDDWAVTSSESSPGIYGSLLVELGAAGRSGSPLTVGVVESFSFLKRRLNAMNKMHARPGWVRPIAVAVVALAAVGLLPWNIVAATPRSSPTPAGLSGRASTRPESKAQASGATKTPVSAPLATTSVGQYRIAVDSVRPAPHARMNLVSSGLPISANIIGDESKSFSTSSGGRGGGGFSGGRAGAGVGRATTGDPNLVVDLHVTRAGSKNDLLCVVLGRVQAQDDTGQMMQSSELPAHLKGELEGFSYERGSGCAAIHLHAKNEDAREIKNMSGELLVTDAKIQTAIFEEKDFSKPTSARLGGVVVRLNSLQATPDGIQVEAAVSMPNPFQDRLNFENMQNRLKVEMEDTEGQIHRPRSCSGGASGGGSGGGSSSGGGGHSSAIAGGSSGGGGGGFGRRAGGTSDNSSESAMAGYQLEFAPLPESVTPRKLICTVVELQGTPKKVAFAFNDLPLPRQ